MVNQMNRGGMESRLMDLYRNIDKSKVQFDFYTFRNEPGEFDSEIMSLGGKVYYNNGLRIKHLLKNVKDLRTFFSIHKEYKIVHCHMNQWCGIILYSAKKEGVKVRIAHSRTSLKNISIKNIIKNLVKLPVNSVATHRFAVSKQAAEWLYGKKMVQDGNVRVWPNAIECNKFAFNEEIRKKVRNKLGLDNELTLIHVGNIREEKNHEYLLRVFLHLKKKIPDAKLIIVGKDNRNGFIQNLAKKLELFDDILFLGARSDVNELLQAGDVFVFPSHYEGFPGAVLEAEASGLSCVISQNITEEVCIGGFARRLPIDKNYAMWVECILNRPNIERREAYKIVANKGYNINFLVKKMERFYIENNL